jgi:hypothetical protein
MVRPAKRKKKVDGTKCFARSVKRPVRWVWENRFGEIVKRTAVKTHICARCENEIRPGEEYYILRRFGSLRRTKVCKRCWE